MHVTDLSPLRPLVHHSATDPYVHSKYGYYVLLMKVKRSNLLTDAVAYRSRRQEKEHVPK